VDPRLLIVDDEVEMTELTVELFALQGIKADTCSSMAQALKCLDTTRYDALVTDVKLANGEDGLELCDLASKRWPDLVVVVLSGDSSARARALALGAQEFFTKPVVLSTVSGFIKGALRSRG
jgi:two-component system response regulator PilR (NtrC family)